MGRPRKYFTEEERKAAYREYMKRYTEKNRERLNEYQRYYYERNKDEKHFQRMRNKSMDTQNAKAAKMYYSYRRSDREHNRGEGDLTKKWIIENILSKPCAHCGETDWHKIGCNRLDNSKPHTMDNVEPCCWECNNKLQNENQKKLLDQINTTTGEVIRTWKSSVDVEKETGYKAACIRGCCGGKCKTYRGYKWRYISQ